MANIKTNAPATNAPAAPVKKPAVAAEIAGTTLRLEFADGKELVLNLESLTPEIREYAAMHGLKQKLVDAAAIARDPETGRTASIADKYEAVKAVYERISGIGQEASWNAVRQGGEGTTGGLLLRALVRIYEGRKTQEELVEYLAARTDAEKAALRKSARVAPVIAELRDAAKGRGIDGDALLSELED